ncbi:MAG: hypothetical protein ACJ796_14465 [Gemmatimonadaceae bacterium]
MSPPRRVKVHWPSSVVVLLGLVIGGCRASTEPAVALLQGTFVLRTLNGAALPADLSTEPSYHLFLVADTLRFDGKGAATRGRTMQQRYDGAAATILHYDIDYSYRIADHTVYLEIRCPITAQCVSSPSGQVVGRDLLLVQFGDATYVFVRVKGA